MEFENARTEEEADDAAEAELTDVEEEVRTAKLTMHPQSVLHLRHTEVDEDDLNTPKTDFEGVGRFKRHPHSHR